MTTKNERLNKSELQLAVARAEKAEADLAALGECHDDNCRALVKIAEELATERARLDWLGDNVEEIYRERDQRGSCVYLSGENIRDAIDAATKGGAQ